MNRLEFQKVSVIRLNEARSLLKSGHYDGAYYLLGYAVECALKACITKQFRKYDLPDKKIVNDVYTHNLGNLLKISGLKQEFDKDSKNNQTLEVNWAVVKDWNEGFRYKEGMTKTVVDDFYSACTARKNGVLTWLRKKW